MKYLLPALFLFTGCEVLHRPGIVVRDKVAYTGKYGPGEKTADIITINGDVPGLSEVPTPYGPIRIAQVNGQGQRLIVSGTTVLGTESYPVLGGLNVTDPIAARGVADRFRAKEFWSGVTGAALSLGTAAVAGPASGAIPRP